MDYFQFTHLQLELLTSKLWQIVSYVKQKYRSRKVQKLTAISEICSTDWHQMQH